jgi:hypothetical protein
MSPTSASVGESRYLIGNERSTAFEDEDKIGRVETLLGLLQSADE